MNSERDQIASLADSVGDAIQSINHLTLGAVIPAPEVYEILGALKMVGHRLPQTLGQLGAGLGRSLVEMDVYEDDYTDPRRSVGLAVSHLTRAIYLASELGDELEKAQVAVRGQGYRGRTAEPVTPSEVQRKE